MELDEIKDLARKSANQQEFEPKRDEWHSHYYGFIFGMQEGIKLGQKLPKDSVSKSVICDYCKNTGWDSYPNHDTTPRPCPECQP